MQDTPEPPSPEADLPPHLTLLRRLVTLLMVVMIAGVIAIVTLLVIRLGADTAPVLVTPEAYDLPEGVAPVGYSVVSGRAVLVGDDGVIRIFDAATGAPLQTFDLDP